VSGKNSRELILKRLNNLQCRAEGGFFLGALVGAGTVVVTGGMEVGATTPVYAVLPDTASETRVFAIALRTHVTA